MYPKSDHRPKVTPSAQAAGKSSSETGGAGSVSYPAPHASGSTRPNSTSGTANNIYGAANTGCAAAVPAPSSSPSTPSTRYTQSNPYANVQSPPPPPPPVVNSDATVPPPGEAIPHGTLDSTGENCLCAMCRLGRHIGYLYAGQRRASPHVLSSRPAPYAAPLPELPPVRAPAIAAGRCPVMDSYGFCPYSRCCYLAHGPADASAPPLPGSATAAAAGPSSPARHGQRPPPPAPRVARSPDGADGELLRLRALAAEHAAGDEEWACHVCGQRGIGPTSVAPVGETCFYRHCPRCSFMCYFPYVTYLVDALLAAAGDDYQAFKDGVDRCRRLAPDEFKVPLSLEAHRQGSIVFAWSLLSPADARDAVDAARRALPGMQCVVSMGSGGGYVEHVFNRVMNVLPDAARWSGGGPASPSSFDGVRAAGYGEGPPTPIYAFDELLLRTPYSVHVSLGGPLAILSMPCSRTVLLLCWPPFGSPQEEQSSMAYEALEYFTSQGGRVVIYVGDVASTGDWRFHQMLYTHYRLVPEYPVRREVRRWCPQEMGLVYAGNDTVGVYRARDHPLPLPPNWSCGM